MFEMCHNPLISQGGEDNWAPPSVRWQHRRWHRGREKNVCSQHGDGPNSARVIMSAEEGPTVLNNTSPRGKHQSMGEQTSTQHWRAGMTPQERHGDMFCSSSFVFIPNVGVSGHRIRPMGGIVSIHESPERFCGGENVIRA